MTLTRPVSPPEAHAAPADGQHSGELVRPIHCILRSAVTAETARTELEAYKLSLRRYLPLSEHLPWRCQAHCTCCDATVPAEFAHDAAEDRVYLSFDCPTCGRYREAHHDVLIVRSTEAERARSGPHQPTHTHAGSPVRPPVKGLPRTVETLCPECSCIILGRYYVKDNVVFIEKTCPEHGYFRDTISTDARLFRKAAEAVFQDERGVRAPQVHDAQSCPSDCGLCDQHLSTSCLAQIDLTNRCNLTCPVCFANANAAGYVAEPTYEMVVEMLQALRDQHPCPATAVQFTGGEPTVHPDFFRILRAANEMGFTHVQAATNGIALANLEFARRAAEAGLHTLYLQFDGLDDECYRKTCGRPLLEFKLACVENCKQTGTKICLVPTIIKGVNDDQVGEIFQFAVDNIECVSAISYQPVAFTGRINRRELAERRYTLGDLAHDLAAASGADLERDFWPLGMIAPLSRIMECIDGKSKIRSSCHSDCAFGTYFFVTPDRRAIPIPQLFDMHGLMSDFNELSKEIKARHPQADTWERLRIAWLFIKRYRWRELLTCDVRPWTFVRALQGLTNKSKGRGESEKASYKTLMAAGMHFMDRYNYDTDRVRRCVILYSTPDGVYPFCTLNGGPTYRPFIERMLREDGRDWQARHPHMPLRPEPHPDALAP
jgi:uncharacterized radical SAM superfamily Fe-S cluster-containing enzyme